MRVATYRLSPLAHQLFMGVIGVPFLRALVFPYFVLLLLLAASDASTDWFLLRAQLQSMSPMARATLLTTLITIWSSVSGHSLRRVWKQRSVRMLARLPIGPGEWLIRSLPALLLALVPLLALMWLGTVGMVPSVGVVGLSLSIIFGVSMAGRVGYATAVGGVALLFAGVLATSYGGIAPYAGLLLAAVTFGPTVTLLRARIVLSDAGRTGTLVSRNPVALLVRLDLLAAQRANRWAVANTLALTGLGLAMMAAIRVNGGVSGREALISATILFAVAVSSSYATLDSARLALGENLLRKRWPITVTNRGVAICAVVALFMMPAAVTIAVMGSTMGWFNRLIFCAFVTTQVFLTAGHFSSHLRDSASAIGWFLQLLVAHVIFALVAPPAVYLSVAGGVSVLSWMRLIEGLRLFTTGSQEAR